jgi:hypothetical protein
MRAMKSSSNGTFTPPVKRECACKWEAAGSSSGSGSGSSFGFGFGFVAPYVAKRKVFSSVVAYISISRPRRINQINYG